LRAVTVSNRLGPVSASHQSILLAGTVKHVTLSFLIRRHRSTYPT